MNPMSICTPSSSSSSSSGSSISTKAWIVHGVVIGAAVAVALGAHAYLYLRLGSSKFRSRVVGIIPVRFASSRFQGKPLVQILGKPMIQVLLTTHYYHSPSIAIALLYFVSNLNLNFVFSLF
ncbi:hypothetical protein CsSME_00018565 [Camellia sinensis var. sinensis]